MNVKSKNSSNSKKREKLWTFYHQKAIDAMPALLQELYTNLTIPEPDQLFDQAVNLFLFEDLLKGYFKVYVHATPHQHILSTDCQHLSKDELNALRYACGYVAHKLLKKYEKEHDNGKFAQYEMCLGNMAVFGDTSDFTKYTTEWLEKVNRGGLFPLNDTSFIFLLPLKMSSVGHYQSSTLETKDKVSSNVC